MKHTNDIIRMAREADIDWHKHWNDDESNRLEVFAALVEDAQAKRMHEEGMVTVGHMREQIAAERNKLAQWMIDHSYATGHGDTTEDLLDELDWQITESWSKVVVASVEAEREACAKVCETKLGPTATDYYGKTYAATIRARGQA